MSELIDLTNPETLMARWMAVSESQNIQEFSIAHN